MSDAEYQQLTKSGIIEDTSSKFGKTIDDYEDEKAQRVNEIGHVFPILTNAKIPENPELLRIANKAHKHGFKKQYRHIFSSNLTDEQ